MKKLVIIFYAVIILLIAQNIYSQVFYNSRVVTGNSGGTEMGKGICADAFGNTYATGKFNGGPGFPVYFPGGVPLSSYGNFDAFICKFNSSGNTVWAKHAGSSSVSLEDEGNGICIDNSGNLYITGTYHGTATFEGTTITSAGASDIFIAKYSNSGNLLWVRSAGGTDYDKGCKIAFENGIVYVTGVYKIQASFGGITVNNPSGDGTFLAAYTASGASVWVQTSTGGNTVDNVSLAVKNGFAYITGSWSGGGALVFGAHSLTSPGLKKVFIVKYNLSSQTALWATYGFSESISSGWTAYGYGIDVDNAGNVYVTGSFEKTLYFGSLTAIASGTGTSGSGASDVYLVKHNSSGVPQWLTSGGSPDNLDVAYDVKVQNSAIVVITGSHSSNATFGLSILQGHENTLDIFVAKYNSSNGNLVWALGDGSYSSHDEGMALTFNGHEKIALTGYTFPATYGADTVETANVWIDVLFTGVSGNPGLIHGIVFKDANANGIFDGSDQKLPNVLIKTNSPAAGDQYFLTNSAGMYIALVSQTGTYSISAMTPLLYYTFNPSSHSAVITPITQFVSNKNFAYVPIEGKQDVKITYTSLMNFPRPGFLHTYQITYTNVGTTTISSGSVVMNFDLTKMTYSSSSPSGTYIGGNNYVTWNNTNLTPGSSRTITVHYYISVGAPLGSVINTSVTVNPITGDLTPLNNTTSLAEIVRGSYDPNDKQVSHDTLITPSEAANGDSLIYTVRFQNTGTADAININILDTLSSNLNLGTLEVIDASHSYTYDLNDGILEFHFDNINLPDSNANEPASHGYIKYQIDMKNSLNIGDEIRNTAYIYFDFNDAIITNTAINKINLPLPVELTSFSSEVDKNSVILRWQTGFEINNSGFDIERKTPTSSWTKTGFVTGGGSVNEIRNYNFEDKNLSSGNYYYRLKQVDYNGNYEYFNLLNDVVIGVPMKFDLSQNYPNPFNPATKINYDLPFDSKVQIKIYDMTGREVHQLVNQVQVAGYYTTQFNASSLASGVYFYQINATGGKQSFVKTMKMVLVK